MFIVQYTTKPDGKDAKIIVKNNGKNANIFAITTIKDFNQYNIDTKYLRSVLRNLNVNEKVFKEYPYISKNKTQIAKAEPTVKPKKKVKVVKKEPKQEEFKSKKTNQDNEAPVIQIAEAITVNSQAYTLKGKIKDKSQIYLTINGRQVDVKKGKFELDRFSIDPDVAEELKIVAIDSVFGFICPTTCGRSALNLISFPSKSKITSPGINPPLSPDSPSSKSFIKAPYGLSIPRASARSLSTSPTLTPK